MSQPSASNSPRSSTCAATPGISNCSYHAVTEIRAAPGPTSKGTYTHWSMPTGARPVNVRDVVVAVPVRCVRVRALATCAGASAARPAAASTEPARSRRRRDIPGKSSDMGPIVAHAGEPLVERAVKPATRE
ncbi:hypothetical protein ACFSVJ_03935 [Prauserella oleivorans]